MTHAIVYPWIINSNSQEAKPLSYKIKRVKEFFKSENVSQWLLMRQITSLIHISEGQNIEYPPEDCRPLSWGKIRWTLHIAYYVQADNSENAEYSTSPVGKNSYLRGLTARIHILYTLICVLSENHGPVWSFSGHYLPRNQYAGLDLRCVNFCPRQYKHKARYITFSAKSDQ